MTYKIRRLSDVHPGAAQWAAVPAGLITHGPGVIWLHPLRGAMILRMCTATLVKRSCLAFALAVAMRPALRPDSAPGAGASSKHYIPEGSA
jgi:hypothetical protein